MTRITAHIFLAGAMLLLLAPLSRSLAADMPADIQLPEGFRISVYAEGVDNARSLALGDRNTVFVSTRRDGRIYAVVPQRGNRPHVIEIASGLQMPNGIAWHDGDLYVAEMSRILRYDDIEQHLHNAPEPVVINDNLPDERHHGWRYIAFGPDGRLYLSIGAPCNVCDRDGFGIIVSMLPDGSDRRVEARGVRNSVGLTWHPQSGELWFTDNGRDMLGDDTPPGELNHLSARGEHFGFPFCHGADVPDPEYGAERACAEFRAPAQELGPHVAPLGLRFYAGNLFPASYRGQLFIAEHGSWNRSEKIGYRVTMVRFDNGRPTGYEVFAEGWLGDDESVHGRPVDLLIMRDGSMLLSDDLNGLLYRITWSEPVAGLRRGSGW